MITAVLGGLLIGAGAVWLMLSLGRVAGISGIVANALMRPAQSVWTIIFILGLGIGGWLGSALVGYSPAGLETANLPVLSIGGLLVGFGTRLGSGYTSGHGVCGIARLSLRSIIATVVFIGVGMITATLVHQL